MSMEPIMDSIKDISQCIAVDLRGCGFSSYNTPVRYFEDYATDIKLLLNEHIP